ncbi:MAG: hypothetical protein H6621_12970 [Halobacteriovoraceae bacterium]|nr:hypothetical protein [Halobacteriovoraceae bacterium]MCB9095974.1 hypothetical protein [Halobacteriovoraceae bacterium]
MEVLNPFERIIIESLYNSEKTIDELSRELSIDPESLFYMLQKMLIKGFVSFKTGKYSISSHCYKSLKSSLDNKQSQSFEIKTILDSATDGYIYDDDKNKLTIKKVYLTQDEKSLLDSLLKQLESFMATKAVKPTNNQLHEKEIFYWGRQTYKDILDHIKINYQAA